MNTISSFSVSKEQFSRDTDLLIELSAEAYRVFGALGNLTEDLRVLSFNAEFASGRAGAKGNCVRVLTQATRELVNALSRRYENIQSNREVTRDAATVIKNTVAISNDSAYDVEKSTEELRSLVRANDQLSSEMSAISAIAQECDGIAVAIAVEAATAGIFREEFQQVADTMHRYVEELQNMVTKVARNVRRFKDRGSRLLDRMSESQNKSSKAA
jgi:methyl-accepting chemotaxis protein